MVSAAKPLCSDCLDGLALGFCANALQCSSQTAALCKCMHLLLTECDQKKGQSLPRIDCFAARMQGVLQRFFSVSF